MEKNKLMMTIIIVLLVILLVAIGGVSFLAYRMLSNQNEGTEQVYSNTNTAKKQLTASEIEYVTLENPVSVNLTDSADGSSHSVSVKFDIGIDNTDKKLSPDFIALVNNQKTVIKDVVIGILRSKTLEEMKSTDTQELVKQEVIEKLQLEFDSDLIYNIKFDTFYYD